jgi:hypothetical protein
MKAFHLPADNQKEMSQNVSEITREEKERDLNERKIL